MKTEHTPGPWEFRVYSNGCTIVSKHDVPGRSVRDWLKGVKIQVEALIYDELSNARVASPDARLMVAAQVHTHPQEAFHSPADDHWAVLRHVGALSLVLPCFARDTTADTFVEQAKVYSLTQADEWDEIPFQRDITIR